MEKAEKLKISTGLKPIRKSTKGQKLKTKTNEQVQILKEFFEINGSQTWSGVEVQMLSS